MIDSGKKTLSEPLLDIFRGFLIGIANVIPGVSGGTFALILGVYERLINALAGLRARLFLDMIRAGQRRGVLRHYDLLFLLRMLSGAAAALIVFSWIIDYVLVSHTSATLSFFLGLVIPSIAVPYRLIEERKLFSALFAVPGIILVAASGYVTPAAAGEISLPFVFMSGAVAISAMILPGISGSFLLLVMGVYYPLIRNIKDITVSPGAAPLIFLSVFAVGCIAGFTFFVRIMRFMLERFRDRTYFFLIGLVAGSAAVLWPFKDFSSGTGIESGIRASNNVLPSGTYDIAVLVIFFTLGFAASLLMSRLAKE